MAVVGAGRAGGSLARLWHQTGNVNIKAVYSRSGAEELAEAVGADVPEVIANLPDTDFLLIATPDASLKSVATQIAQESVYSGKREAIAFHLSGACSSDELAPLKTCGFKLASVHPLRSFASTDQPNFSETWCAIEGNKDALPALRQLFECIGGRCFEINKNAKTAYHAASVISSNGLFALGDVALAAWQRAGIDPDLAREIFASLAVETANNIARFGPAEALTGPLSRGDSAVVSNQLKELESNDKSGAEIYRALSMRLLTLAGDRLDQEKVKQLREMLTLPDEDVQ